MVGASLAAAAAALPLFCTSCTNMAADPLYWASNIVGTALGAGATLAGYMARRRGEAKARAREMAKSVQREIVRILVELNDTTRTAIRMQPHPAIERLPTGTYDGLLNSAEISRFDTGMQDELYIFYNLFKNKPLGAVQMEHIRSRGITVSEQLDEYIHRNRARWGVF